MEAIRAKSPINGMYTHKIKADEGRIYDIERSWTGELHVGRASDRPEWNANTVIPFEKMPPDLAHKTIKCLTNKAVRVFNKHARDSKSTTATLKSKD